MLRHHTSKNNFPLVSDLRRQRERMVITQLEQRGINNSYVLTAMRNVHRHLFVPEALQSHAYDDYPLPIGCGQTISRPYIVAIMTSLLEPTPGLSVLEIGTGSGYQTAILATIGLEVFSIERVRELYFQTKELFFLLGYRKIRTCLSDGTLGWEEHAPFDRIIVTAGGPNIPLPLLNQLGDPGVMVIPVGQNPREQELMCITKKNNTVTSTVIGNVAFVDLVGDYGW